MTGTSSGPGEATARLLSEKSREQPQLNPGKHLIAVQDRTIQVDRRCGRTG